MLLHKPTMGYRLSSKEKDDSLAFVVSDAVMEAMSLEDTTKANKPQMLEVARIAYNEHMEGSDMVRCSKQAAMKDKAVAEYVLKKEEFIWETICRILDSIAATIH